MVDCVRSLPKMVFNTESLSSADCPSIVVDNDNRVVRVVWLVCGVLTNESSRARKFFYENVLGKVRSGTQNIGQKLYQIIYRFSELY